MLALAGFKPVSIASWIVSFETDRRGLTKKAPRRAGPI
jgi:hypothetical protein